MMNSRMKPAEAADMPTDTGIFASVSNGSLKPRALTSGWGWLPIARLPIC